jgi:hypothetical protein
MGERWGERLARGAVYQSLLRRFIEKGPRAIERELRSLGYSRGDADELEEWFYTGVWRRWRPGRWPYGGPDELLYALADIRAPELLGQSARVSTLGYSNPLVVELGGSGFLIAGSIYALRMVRDWSSRRRIGAADARDAEARASGEEARAELLQWLVDEAKAGRMPVPAGDLLQLVTASDVEAVDRLAEEEISLRLPSGLDPAGETDNE